MAEIEFKVGAVLDDTKLNDQLRNLTQNTQANISVNVDTQQAQQSINKLKTQVVKVFGKMKASDIAQRLGLGEFDSLDERVQQLANNMAKITSTHTTTDGMGNITGSVIEYKDAVGNTVKETLRWKTVSTEVINGIKTEFKKLVTEELVYNDNIEKIEQNEAKQKQKKADEMFRNQSNAMRDISKLEQQQVSAGSEGKKAYQDKIDYYNRILQKLKEQENSEKSLTNEQRQQLVDLQKELDLQKNIAVAKDKDKKQEQAQRQKEQQDLALKRLGTPVEGIDLSKTKLDDFRELSETLHSSGVSFNKNTDIIKQFSKGVDGAGNALTKFTVRQNKAINGKNYWRDTTYAVSELDGQLRKVNVSQQEVLGSEQSLGNMLTSAIERFAMWGIAMKLWTSIGNAIQDATQYTIDLNTAMTNIRVVTMDTKEATEDLLQTYNQLGQELGANTLDIAEGSLEWLRQGYSTAETQELVKDSVILSKLALIDEAQATEYLTSAMKGYKLEAQDTIGVIDQLVSIDLVAATSASDMAEAIK